MQKGTRGHKARKVAKPMTGEEFEMGRHDNEEVKKGTEMKLRKQAGVPKKR